MSNETAIPGYDFFVQTAQGLADFNGLGVVIYANIPSFDGILRSGLEDRLNTQVLPGTGFDTIGTHTIERACERFLKRGLLREGPTYRSSPTYLKTDLGRRFNTLAYRLMDMGGLPLNFSLVGLLGHKVEEIRDRLRILESLAYEPSQDWTEAEIVEELDLNPSPVGDCLARFAEPGYKVATWQSPLKGIHRGFVYYPINLVPNEKPIQEDIILTPQVSTACLDMKAAKIPITSESVTDRLWVAGSRTSYSGLFKRVQKILGAWANQEKMGVEGGLIGQQVLGKAQITQDVGIPLWFRLLKSAGEAFNGNIFLLERMRSDLKDGLTSEEVIALSKKSATLYYPHSKKGKDAASKDQPDRVFNALIDWSQRNVGICAPPGEISIILTNIGKPLGKHEVRKILYELTTVVNPTTGQYKVAAYYLRGRMVFSPIFDKDLKKD